MSAAGWQIPLLVLAIAFPVAFIRGAWNVVFACLIALLITISHTVSSLTIGAIPVCSLLLALLLFDKRKEVGTAFRLLPALRWASGLWLIWLVWVLIRLSGDLPEYGVVAARDAVPMVDFAGLLLGAALVFAHSSDARSRVLDKWLIFAAAYSLIYPFHSVLEEADTPILSFSNVGVMGATLYAAGLWARTPGRRIFFLATGLASIFISQGRMVYIAAIALTVVFIVMRQREISEMGRADEHGRLPVVVKSRGATRLTALTAIVLISLSLLATIPRIPGISGRLGDVSVSAMAGQLGQVTAGEATSGSVADRQRWWSEIVGQMRSQPSYMWTGMGLGRDLLNGFRSRDGVLVRKPHNDFLEWFARTGILGLLGVTVLVLLSVSYSWRALKLDVKNAPLFAWALTAAMTSWAQPYLAYSHGVLPMALILGYSIAVTSGVNSETRVPGDRPKRAEVLV